MPLFEVLQTRLFLPLHNNSVFFMQFFVTSLNCQYMKCSKGVQ